MYAVESGQDEIAVALIGEGCDFDTYAIDGMSALQLAQYYHRHIVIQIITSIKYKHVIEAAGDKYMERKMMMKKNSVETVEEEEVGMDGYSGEGTGTDRRSRRGGKRRKHEMVHEHAALSDNMPFQPATRWKKTVAH